MSNIYGIDVSKHNGIVNMPKVFGAGKKFVMVRLGWAGHDGRIVANGGLDPRFKENVLNARAAGLEVGVYLYSYCKTRQAAVIAANETLELIAGYDITYPVAFDIESVSTTEPNGTPYDKMTKAENTAICIGFLSTIEQAGYYAQLYTFRSFAQAYLNMNDLTAYDFWIAAWASSPGYDGAYGMWQYLGDKTSTSVAGMCDGVTGPCDLNVAFKDYAAIIRANGLNKQSLAEDEEPVEEPPAPSVSDLEDAIAEMELAIAKAKYALAQL